MVKSPHKTFFQYLASVTIALSAFCDLASAEDLPLRPFLETYCIKCHGGEKTEAEINLRSDSYDQISLLRRRDVWNRVLEQIEFEDMPPKGPLPSQQEYLSTIHYINKSINEVDWHQFHDPGRMELARLTTIEYKNSIRDIFGIDLQAGEFLGKDPEGNTGFTNDRDSLTFPLFAFDNFMRESERESERAVDAWLSYGRKPWSQKIDPVAAWKSSSDRSVDLTDSGDAILIKERNAPYQVNLDLPFAGMYRIAFRIRTVNGEPISAMRIVVNGKTIERKVILGNQINTYSVRLNLPAGANVVSLGYDPDRAPIIQKNYQPRTVPKSITARVQKPKIKEFPLPDHLKSNQQATKAWKKLNINIRAFVLTQRLADHLVDIDKVDYEDHMMVPNQQRQIGTFSPSKVPFNLSAGGVAVFAKIPQAKLEKQIKEITGFSHDTYRKSVLRYKAKWKDRYPERVRKVAGRLAIHQIEITSHALSKTDSNPAPTIQATTDSTIHTRKLIFQLGCRAYGRTIEKAEVDRLMRIYTSAREETGSHTEGLRDALVGMLVSPPFLLRYYEKGDFHQYDLAERMSRFLWLSVPDTTLRSLAKRGKLSNAIVVKSSIDRLIESPKFDSMATTFVEQWLDLESLSVYESSNKISSHKIFAMREEPIYLFKEVFRENRNLFELIDADYTFLNDSLALHYDIRGIAGQTMRAVQLPNDQRGGLLSMAGILTTTSTPERTSPVRRGAFIVELLLGENLPPPPPNVPELEAGEKAGTVREELEAHRASKACSGCHNRIDPYGIVLEHYDQFGAWRDKDKGKPVSASTELEDGTSIDGLVEFRNYILTQRKDDFLRNITSRLFEFALGRKTEFTDEATIRDIMAKVAQNNYRARTLVYEIVNSEAFQNQVDSTPTNE